MEPRQVAAVYRVLHKAEGGCDYDTGVVNYHDYWTGELVVRRFWSSSDFDYCPPGCSCEAYEDHGHADLYDVLDSMTCVHMVFEDELVTRRFEQAEQRVEEARRDLETVIAEFKARKSALLQARRSYESHVASCAACEQGYACEDGEFYRSTVALWEAATAK